MSDWKNVQYKNGKMRTSEGGGGGGSSTFAGLDDVSFNNLQNGQVPKYNSTTQKWENANESGGGGNVTDVTVGGASVVNQQGVAEIPTIPDGLHHYSTTEQVVGTWIDGKLLYERTYNKTLPSAHDHDNRTSYLIDSDVSYIDTLANINGFIYDSNGNCSALNGGIPRLEGWSYGIHKNANDELVLYGASQTTYIGNGKALITLQYTKTTD